MPEEETRNAERPVGVCANGPGRMFVHRIVRYAPSPLRDEWVNIGVLLFDPQTGDGRLRLIEEEEEYNRVRRLHPQADESLLRALRDDLESRFEIAALTRERSGTKGNGGSQHGRYLAGSGERPGAGGWPRVLEKWDQTLSNALRLADPKATRADDLDSELARLYDDRVAAPQTARAGLLASRSDLRSC
jgi:hypothetical protein